MATWWLFTYINAFILQTILFFSLGSYFSIHDFNPLELVIKHKKILVALFVLFAITDIFTHTISGTVFNLQAHRLALIFNIPFLLLVADYCVQRGFSNKMLPNAAFIVFAVHYPIVVILRKICVIKFASAPDSMHILLYFLCVIISTLLSLLIYRILESYFPKLKSILSGSR